MAKREEMLVKQEKRMLSADEYRAWKDLVCRGLAQYGLKKADLADQQRRTTGRDLIFERAGVQRRAADPLRHKNRDQIRRLVENALSRRCSDETARLIVWRVLNAKLAIAWRLAKSETSPDPWQAEVFELIHGGVRYVTGRPPVQKPTLLAFIHPKAVEAFVRETLADVGTLISSRASQAVGAAMIESIARNNEGRSKAVADWFLQSDAFIDVRVYEGPWRDPYSGTEVQVRELRHRRVKWSNPREPLASGERLPEAHERLRALFRDVFADSFEPQASRTFVLPPIGVSKISFDDGNVRISGEASPKDERPQKK